MAPKSNESHSELQRWDLQAVSWRTYMRQEASGDFMDEREEAQGIADPSAGLQKSAIIAFLRVALYTMAFKF